jgi:hypothetical protein
MARNNRYKISKEGRSQLMILQLKSKDSVKEILKHK